MEWYRWRLVILIAIRGFSAVDFQISDFKIMPPDIEAR